MVPIWPPERAPAGLTSALLYKKALGRRYRMQRKSKSYVPTSTTTTTYYDINELLGYKPDNPMCVCVCVCVCVF